MSASPRAAQILLVGQKIRQIRKSRRLTQADLAARIGVTQSDLSRMENGEYKVGLDTLFKILQVFELSMSRFFDEPTPELGVVEDEVGLESGSDGEDAILPEQVQILRDLAALSQESLREVRDFIAFKKLQAVPSPTGWRPAASSSSERLERVPSAPRPLREVSRNDVG